MQVGNDISMQNEIDVQMAVIEKEVQLEDNVNIQVHTLTNPTIVGEQTSLNPDIGTNSLVTVEEVMKLQQQQQLHNQDVVQSIAKKESEILSMIMLNNEDTKQPGSNVKEEGNNSILDGTKDPLLQPQSNLDTGQSNPEMENVVTMEFHAADAAWITLFDSFEFVINDCRIRGYVDGEKKFLCLWECFQTSTMSTFTVRSSDRYYKEAKEGEEGSIQGRILKGSPKWSRTPLIPYDGIPFVSIDRKYFGCR